MNNGDKKNLQKKKVDLKALRRRSIMLRIIAILLTVAIIVCMIFSFRYYRIRKAIAEQEEQTRIEARDSILAAEREKLEKEFEAENARQRQVADSLEAAGKPSYTFEDVERMVRKKVPAYTNVNLWRRDNDNWVMQYMVEYEGCEHWFMRRFNPTKKKFREAKEYGTLRYKNADDGRGVFEWKKDARCSFTEDSNWGFLTYYEDGKCMGVYTREGIREIKRLLAKELSPLAKKRIKQLEMGPPEYEEEGYESWEDYYEDNADDLYFEHDGW